MGKWAQRAGEETAGAVPGIAAAMASRIAQWCIPLRQQQAGSRDSAPVVSATIGGPSQ